MQIHNLCGKARHATNEEAQRELTKLLLNGARLDTLRIYECGFCSAPDAPIFHVGNDLTDEERQRGEGRRVKRRGVRRWLRMLG